MNRKALALALISILLFSALIVTQLANSAIAQPSSFTWVIQDVQTIGALGYPSLALDSNDNPHIAYLRYFKNDYYNPVNVTCASWNGSAWETQTLESGESPSLVLDSNNNPCICYIYSTPTSSYVKYTIWTGSYWNNQTVDSSFTSSFGLSINSLKLASNNNPHVSYIGESELNNTLMYGEWTGSNWNTMILDSNESSNFHSASISLDSSSYPHIIYGESINTGERDESGGLIYLNNVKYAEWNGQSWNIQTVFLNVTSFGNVALDSNGYPHFTYSVESSVEYASWNGSNWHSEFVDSNNPIFDDRGLTFLALDSRDKPHISYWRAPEIGSGGSGSLMYAYQTGSAWKTEIVDNNGTDYGAGPIALDSSGNPHISYPSFHPSDPMHYRNVKYATRQESPTTQEPFPTLLIIAVTVTIVAVVGLGLLVYFKKHK